MGTVTVQISRESYDFLCRLAERIATQDNRATAKPYFYVIRNKEDARDQDNCFLTEAAYLQHVRLNAHNLRKGYYSYLKHAFRNPEMEDLFKAIAEFLPGPSESP